MVWAENRFDLKNFGTGAPCIRAQRGEVAHFEAIEGMLIRRGRLGMALGRPSKGPLVLSKGRRLGPGPKRVPAKGKFSFLRPE